MAGRPIVLAPGTQHGIFKIIERIERNKYRVECTQCGTISERYVKSRVQIESTKRCIDCRNNYNKRLYQRWAHFIKNVPKQEIDPVFLTYKGWETWVLTQSNYSEEDGFIYFYRTGAVHKYCPEHCAFSRTKVNLRHHMEDIRTSPTYLLDYQIKEIESNENANEYNEY